MDDILDITLDSPAFETDDVHVFRLVGTEAISSLFSFEIDVATTPGKPLDVERTRGATLSIVFRHQGELVRKICGMVTTIEETLDLDSDHRRYLLRVAPRAHRCTLVRTQDILLETSWPDVIAEKLERVGLGSTLEMRLDATYAERDFVVQYDETDLAFISRLAEHVGISFYFTHEEEDRILFTDHNEGFASHPEAIPFRRRTEKHDIYHLSATTHVVPANVVVQDYNYRTPTVDLTASCELASGFGGGVAEYGAHYKNPDEGNVVARIRAEELEAHQKIYRGESSRPVLASGLRIDIEGHPELADANLLITKVEHDARQNPLGWGAGEPSHYHNRFEAIPADRPFRPRRVTPRPRMSGVYTGIVQPIDEDVVGPSAQLDDGGRYRVRMLFDIKPREGWVSHPVRMAQPHSGAGHGMHFPLRPGVEVLIVFANGDPDRPLIVGALDNPVTPSPTIDKNSRQNIISTHSGIQITLRDHE